MRQCPCFFLSFYILNDKTRRLTQRPDDNEAALQTRLQKYKSETEPIIGHYDDKDGHLLCRVNADEAPANVQSECSTTNSKQSSLHSRCNSDFLAERSLETILEVIDCLADVD